MRLENSNPGLKIWFTHAFPVRRCNGVQTTNVNKSGQIICQNNALDVEFSKILVPRSFRVINLGTISKKVKLWYKMKHFRLTYYTWGCLKSNLLVILELELIDKSFSDAKVFGQQTGSPLNLPWAPQPQCSIKKPPQIAEKSTFFITLFDNFEKILLQKVRSILDTNGILFNFFLNYDSKGQPHLLIGK